jgi:hypothetical protein
MEGFDDIKMHGTTIKKIVELLVFPAYNLMENVKVTP